MLRRIPVFILLALTVGATSLQGQIPEGVEGTYRPHPEAEKAVSRLLSPFCPGLMLTQCPAEASRILRDSLHALAVDGWNAEAIEAWMLARHGEEYRAVPQRSGTGLLAWLLPPVALLLGLGVVGFALRGFLGKGARRDVASPEPEASGVGGTSSTLPSDADEVRLREAIRDLEFSEDPVY